MSKTPTVYIVSGQVGSGKTTFAKKLESETEAIRFTPDEWMIKLFSPLPSNEEFDDYYFNCCGIAWNIAQQVLKKGIDVILDFGFWKHCEREKYRKMIRDLGYEFKLYYIQCDTKTIKEHLKIRNNLQPAGTIVIDENAFDFFAPQFEPPESDETPEVISVNIK